MSSGKDIFGNPQGDDVQGNPKDKNANGEKPKDGQGNTPKDMYGNETGSENLRFASLYTFFIWTMFE